MHQVDDDAALGNALSSAALRAQVDEPALESLKLKPLGPHTLQLGVDYAIYLATRSSRIAGELEQPAHIGERHVQQPAMLDELE